MVPVVNEQPERWTHLAAAIRERLSELAWSQADLVRASGVSSFTVRRLMNGEHGNYREANLGRVSQALWGDTRALSRILDGDAVEDPPAEDDGDEVVQAILRSRRLTADQRDLLIVAYRGAIARNEGRAGQVDGEQHHLA